MLLRRCLKRLADSIHLDSRLGSFYAAFPFFPFFSVEPQKFPILSWHCAPRAAAAAVVPLLVFLIRYPLFGGALGSTLLRRYQINTPAAGSWRRAQHSRAYECTVTTCDLRLRSTIYCSVLCNSASLTLSLLIPSFRFIQPDAHSHSHSHVRARVRVHNASFCSRAIRLDSSRALRSSIQQFLHLHLPPSH